MNINILKREGWLNIWFFAPIIDIFDNKTRGLFVLLNDECLLPSPSIANFVKNLKSAWHKEKIVPISWNVHGFAVQHFTNDVTYSPVLQRYFLIVHNSLKKEVYCFVFSAAWCIFFRRQFHWSFFHYLPSSIREKNILF